MILEWEAVSCTRKVPFELVRTGLSTSPILPVQRHFSCLNDQARTVCRQPVPARLRPGSLTRSPSRVQTLPVFDHQSLREFSCSPSVCCPGMIQTSGASERVKLTLTLREGNEPF